MAHGGARKGSGRKAIQLDKSLFENLCKIQCTKIEICEVLDVNEKTVTRWCKEQYNKSYKEVWRIKSAPGRASLRRMQFKAAEAGNSTMLIWLGKQYLGQSDKQDLTQTGGLNISIEWADENGH